MVKEIGYEKWSRITGYFKRFVMEWVFSSFKWLFGESIRAKSLKSAFYSIITCVILFNNIAFKGEETLK